MYIAPTVRALLNLLGKRVRLGSGDVVRIPEDGEWRFFMLVEHQAYMAIRDLYVYVATSPYWDKEYVGPGDILKVLPDEEPDEDNLKEWVLVREPEVYVWSQEGSLSHLLDGRYDLEYRALEPSDD
jgi:hypothetical protein